MNLVGEAHGPFVMPSPHAGGTKVSGTGHAASKSAPLHYAESRDPMLQTNLPSYMRPTESSRHMHLADQVHACVYMNVGMDRQDILSTQEAHDDALTAANDGHLHPFVERYTRLWICQDHAYVHDDVLIATGHRCPCPVASSAMCPCTHLCTRL